MESEDFLRYNPVVRNTLARYKVARAIRQSPNLIGARIRQLDELCSAARIASDEPLLRKIERHIEQRIGQISVGDIPWETLLPDPTSRRLTKGIILKPYISTREKGILYVSFENQMGRMALSENLERLSERYTLVLAPSWCPPHSIYTYLFPQLYPDNIVCCISNTKDLTLFPRINSKYRMVPLYASNWVDAKEFAPIPHAEKTIDIFMLANFAKYKRHHAFFRALRDVPGHFRIVLNGQSEPGRSRDTLLREATAYGVQDRFELQENVSDEQLHHNLTHSKVSVILSMREGSCVAVVESIMANTPVAMLHDAEIGSKEFVTPQSGRLLRHENLGRQLTEFVATSHTYEPRAWAEAEGIGCFESSITLNAALREYAHAQGQLWTQDIVPMRWRPNPQYYDPNDASRMADAHADIASYGLAVWTKTA
jgi:glycosyltransferase involved in cell wall biosynthesis